MLHHGGSFPSGSCVSLALASLTVARFTDIYHLMDISSRRLHRISTSYPPMPPDATCCVLGFFSNRIVREEKRMKITKATNMQQAGIRGVSGPTWSGVFLAKKAEIIAGSLRTMLDYLRTAAFPFCTSASFICFGVQPDTI